MADVNRGNRPLSPHLMIYRPQITSISSIFVRITGNALLLGLLLIVWWFSAAAQGAEAFAVANGVLTCWFGDLVLMGSTLCLWYHTLGGVRHLIWDMGYGFDIQTSERMGLGMMVGSIVLTVITIVVV